MKLSQGAFNKIEEKRKSYRKRKPDSKLKTGELSNTKDIHCERGDKRKKRIENKRKKRIDKTLQEGIKKQEIDSRRKEIAYIVDATCELYGGEDGGKVWKQELEKERKALECTDKPEQKSAERLVAQLYRLNPNKNLYTTNNREIWYAGKAEELNIPDGFYFVKKGNSIYLSNKVNHDPNGIYVEIPIYD